MFPAGPVRLVSVPGTKFMRVLEEFIWQDESGFPNVIVPQGFKTDGASIPRFFWRLIGGPFGPYRDAAVVHDFLYNQAGILGFTRKEADQVFRQVMDELLIGRFTKWAMYRGVRVGAGRVWKEYEKENQRTLDDRARRAGI